MTTKHTPGPWYAMTGDTGGIIDQATVCSEHETDGEPTFIADTMPIDDEVPLEQRKANALLMAAAPDLLAALKGVVRVADRKTVEFDAARAALAKAEAQP